MSKIVVALGGNSLGDTPAKQLLCVKSTAEALADLIEQGNSIIISHGNGPQVGMIQLSMDVAYRDAAIKSPMPLPECVAMSQGYIGYHLQNAIFTALSRRGINRAVVTVTTQVLVDGDDPAFKNPTKPVGSFYTREEAGELSVRMNWTMAEDSGRGWRRVVPSPKPVYVVEKRTIEALYESGSIVIAAGGGGIPVIEQDGELVGVPAVVDKDFSSAKLAELVGADIFLILTGVERVALNFGRPDMRLISSMSAGEAEEYCRQGHFAPGSMLPKIEAALGFVRSRPGGVAIIAALENASAALRGESGTLIHS